MPKILDRDQTLRGYDSWALTYDRHDNPMVAASDVALALRPLDVAGLDVVELGCGTGRHAERLIAGGARSYLGVDGSEGMLAQARGRVADARVRWAAADLEGVLPLEDASADVVLVVLVLEHLPVIAPLFVEIARVLRPGGVLRLIEIHDGLVAGGTVAHFPAEGGEVRFTSTPHPVQEIRAALAGAGLDERWLLEVVADDTLVGRVPRLAKHLGRRVQVDLAAARR